MTITKICPFRHAKGLKRMQVTSMHKTSYTSRNGRTRRNEYEERMINKLDKRRNLCG
jgi:hypothetical protein